MRGFDLDLSRRRRYHVERFDLLQEDVRTVRSAEAVQLALVRDLHFLLRVHVLLDLFGERVVLDGEVERLAHDTGTGVQATADDFRFPGLTEDALAIEASDAADLLAATGVPAAGEENGAQCNEQGAKVLLEHESLRLVVADEKFIGPNIIAPFNHFVHSKSEAPNSNPEAPFC